MTINSKKTNNSSTIHKANTARIVSQGYSAPKKALSIDQINTTYSQPANLVPHFWNYKIVDKDGNPDLPCIMILSELLGWFRNLPKSKTYYSTGNSLPELVQEKLAISYDFLSKKLNFQKERIRRNIIKLEHLGILSREVKNIKIENSSRINQLYISIDSEFFTSCFRTPELDIRVGNKDLSNNHFPDSKCSQLERGEHISKKNIIKDRSKKSNFIDKDLKEKELNTTSSSFEESEKIQKPKNLQDFYPLTESDCRELQKSSGREFGLTAMNEILKNMANKVKKAEFWSKKGFISYMSKAFRYEMRDAVKTNNENFRIKTNYSKEENNIRKQEKYLTEIEYSLQVNPEWHLKKKLASVLERSKAYNLLTSYKNIEIAKDGLCRLELDNIIELTSNDKQIILNQIKATHEKIGIDFCTTSISELEIIMPKYKKESREFLLNQLNRGESLKTRKIQKKKRNIWDEIREILAKQYGEGIDQAWFSKLKANINDDKKEISLRSSSEFIIDWINNNYSQTIKNIASSFEFKLKIESN